MSTKFLRVETENGNQYVSEFNKLGKVQKYAEKIFAGHPFNVWHKISDTHPDSGEPVLFRRRLILKGQTITEIELVKRRTEADPNSYDPVDFEPEAVPEKSPMGYWQAPEAEGELVGGSRPGALYPIHRDNAQLRRYVILTAGEGEDEVRHWLDPERSAPVRGVGGRFASPDDFEPPVIHDVADEEDE